MTATEDQAKTNQKLSQGSSDIQLGTCISIDWTALPEPLARVNVPGSTLDLPMAGLPIINARCRIGLLGNKPVVLGPLQQPPFATVAGTAAGGLVKVTGDDSLPYTVTYSSGMTLTIGTRVQIAWSERGGTIIALPQADTLTGEPIGNAGNIGGGGMQSRTFNPVASGTWRDGYYASGWVSGEVWCSDHNHGGYFYQGIADSIPANAVDLKMSILMVLLGGSGDPPTLGGHSLPGMSGDLSITSPRAFSAGWVEINDLAPAFNSGGLLGIGTNGGGNWRFAAAGQLNAGALGATWRT